MKLDELDRLAFAQADLPKLAMPETYYFLTMRAVYSMHKAGSCTLEQAKAWKKQVVDTYKDFELCHRIGVHDMRVLRDIQYHNGYYSKNGCKVCKELADRICGLMVELSGEVVEA